MNFHVCLLHKSAKFLLPSHTDVCSDTMANLVLFLLVLEPILEVSLFEDLFMLDLSRPAFKLPERFYNDS